MIKLSSIRHHHIAIAALCSLVFASIYQSIYPLPEAKANTVTIVIDIENTHTTAEIPCGSPTAENSDCGIGDIDGYLNHYLSYPANTANKQFLIVPGSTVQRLNITETIALGFPRQCSNCSIEFNGILASGNKLPVISTTSITGSKPALGFWLKDNTNPVTVQNAHFQDFATSAVQITNITNTTASVRNNYFGAMDSATLSNSNAIIVRDSHNAVIDNNTFGGHSGNAVVLNSTDNVRLSNNLFGVTSISNLTTAIPAISGNSLLTDRATDTTISNNIFANSIGHGIELSLGNNNTINEENAFFNNGGRAISLTSNANNGILSPSLTAAHKQGGNLILKGSGVHGATINFYRADNPLSPLVTPDTLGGEGFSFLGSGIIDSINDRNPSTTQFEFIFSVPNELGYIISSFQTSAANSSAFGNNISVSAAPVPTVTPTPTPTNTPTSTPTATPTTTPTPRPNRLPVANAGSDQNASTNAVIQLHGEGSNDPDGDNLSFIWTQHASDRYQVSLSSTSSRGPTFSTPSSIVELQTILHFTLEVNDNRGGISRDEVVVNVSRNRQRPTANLVILPSNRVAPGTEIILDGSNSTFDSSSTTEQYRFHQIPTSQINVSIDQESPTSPQARVLIPASLTASTSLTFSLEVSDGSLNSDVVTATVNVAPQANSNELCTDEAPQATAGRNQTLSRPVGTIVVLDASNSSDPNNTQLSYSWRQMSGGPRVDLRNGDHVTSNFTIPDIESIDTTLRFSVTVSNRCGQSSTATTRVTIKNSDLDSDGISNLREDELGTDSTVADTDSDGLNDGEEIKNFCLSPLNADSDNDGIKDGAEDINHNGITDGGETNPCLFDTDGDGLPDGFEKLYQLNPLNPQDAKEDIDVDNLSNVEEFVYKTHPREKDSDKDGLADGIEVKGLNRTNAIKDDTDNDGILDGNEDINHNGTTDPNETSPVRFDSDFDGLADGLEIGLGNSQAKSTDLSKFAPDIEPRSKTSPLTPDTDGDGILDGTEDRNHNGSFDCGETNPLDTQNTVLLCSSAKPTPTATPLVNKNARSSNPNSIQVQKVPTPTSSGLVQLISPLSDFSISVQKGNTAPKPLNIAIPQINLSPTASIFVLPGIVTNALPSIFVLSNKL